METGPQSREGLRTLLMGCLRESLDVFPHQHSPLSEFHLFSAFPWQCLGFSVSDFDSRHFHCSVHP